MIHRCNSPKSFRCDNKKYFSGTIFPGTRQTIWLLGQLEKRRMDWKIYFRYFELHSDQTNIKEIIVFDSF